MKQLKNVNLSNLREVLLLQMEDLMMPNEVISKVKGMELKPEVCVFLSDIIESFPEDFIKLIEFLGEPLYTLRVLAYALRKGLDINKIYTPNIDSRRLKVLVDCGDKTLLQEDVSWFDMYKEFYNLNTKITKLCEEKVYEFTGETKEYKGRILRRIRYIDEDKNKGGWIEKESNLEHSPYCRLYEEAMIYDNARVEGACTICGYAQVYDNAKVIGTEEELEIRIQDFSKIYGNAQIIGGAVIQGDAKVHDNAKVLGLYVLIDCEAEVYGNAIIYDSAMITEQACVKDNATVGDRAHVGGKATVYGDAQIILFQNVYADMQIDRGFYIKGEPYCVDDKYIDDYIYNVYLPGAYPKDTLIPNYIDEYIPNLYKRLGLDQNKECPRFAYEMNIQTYEREYERFSKILVDYKDWIIYIPSSELPPIMQKSSIKKLDISF